MQNLIIIWKLICFSIYLDIYTSINAYMECSGLSKASRGYGVSLIKRRIINLCWSKDDSHTFQWVHVIYEAATLYVGESYKRISFVAYKHDSTYKLHLGLYYLISNTNHILSCVRSFAYK